MKKEKSNLSLKEEHLNLKGFLTFLLLHELKQASLCGDELAKKIGKRKGSNLTPGTIYPTLKKMRKAKLVAYKRTGRKKNYVLTEAGSKEIDRLYLLFGNYFYGLKTKISNSPKDISKYVNKEDAII